ncbi:Aste57867_21025 [Aphanomyces stellatus]|uniref:Aste57867_21025 protein n=1 Tax=Aphanomyces stellatus TaxID=120398 RepID=A0A485LHV6_9STRA|nr:hypothetical protein As57867_020957 [Aphanomyces stellatus]VFT97700.1 Aste57867_21025 [Aphanomyces stellatus]
MHTASPSCVSHNQFEMSLDIDISNLLQDGIFEYSSSDESSVCTTSSTAAGHSPHKAMSVDGDDDKQVSYLEKLYAMLDECPPSVAAWTRNGAAFAIFEPEALEKTVIPRFFQPIKFESFVRQLNSYRFKKAKFVLHERTVLEFQHANFVHGRPDLLHGIKRRRRIRRKGPKTINEMNDNELRVAMSDLVKFVQTLHADLAETKEIARKLAASRARAHQTVV